jgi:hypothetical protein
MSGKPCRNGDNCHNEKCKFSHPDGREKVIKTDCRYGVNCTNAQCKFIHPESDERQKKLDNIAESKAKRSTESCQYSDGCNNLKCMMIHPNPEARRERIEKCKKRPCNNGSDCKIKFCPYKHDVSSIETKMAKLSV